MYFSIARLFLILSLFAIAVVSTTTLFPFIVGKYAWFRAGVDFALVALLLGILFSSEGETYQKKFIKVVRSPLGIAVGIFVLVFLVSGFLGFDPANSFWSNFERGEGGAQMIHLYVFFLLLTTLFSTEKGWRKILGYTIFVGFLSSVYGFLASYGVSGFIGASFKNDTGFRFQGSVGNPAYVAVYMIFLLFYITYLLVTANKKDLRKNFLETGAIILTAILFLVVFYLAATRGAFLGLLASFFLVVGYLVFSHKRLRKPLGIFGAIIVLAVGMLVYFQNSSFVKNLPGSRIFDISFSARTLGDRTIMWGIALKSFKERPLLGWGPENFYQIFDRNFDTNYFKPPESFGAWFDRAHSLVFDYLAETGILGLLSFLGIFITFYYLFFRTAIRSRLSIVAESKNGIRTEPFLFGSPFVRGLIFALPIAYLIQGFVLFDVLVTYLNLFLFLAFANYHFLSHESLNESVKKIPTH